jgi:hypothetical protein
MKRCAGLPQLKNTNTTSSAIFTGSDVCLK